MAVMTKEGLPGTKAVLRHSHMSASKARQVLDLIRDEEVGRAAELLRATERSAALVISKVLASAVANAVHNDGQDPEDLYVVTCYADEAATLKRWRPRARGRATRIRKRTCHVTIIVSRLPDERLARRRAERDAQGGGRARRVAESRRRADLAGRLSRRRARVADDEAALDETDLEEPAVDDPGLDEAELDGVQLDDEELDDEELDDEELDDEELDDAAEAEMADEVELAEGDVEPDAGTHAEDGGDIAGAGGDAGLARASKDEEEGK
jgi:large subunit ribosomal protein L22